MSEKRFYNQKPLEFELKAVELYSIHQNLRRVADEMGVWSTSIRRILKRHNVIIKPNKVGADHPGWKGGRHFNKGNGYIGVWSPGHPRADGGQYVYEHTLVFEKENGFLPGPKQVLHHIDLDKHNNDILNLFLCNNKKHMQLHRNIEKLIKPLIAKGFIIFKDGEYLLNEI